MGQKKNNDVEEYEPEPTPEEEEQVHELISDYKGYLLAKKDYHTDGSAENKRAMLDKLEQTMDGFEKLGEDIIKDCDFREERELAKRHIQKMKTA